MSRSLNSSSNRRNLPHKNTIKYNILLLGADNLGKSTFANNVLNKMIFTDDSLKRYKNIISENIDNHEYLDNDLDEAVKILNPVRVALYTDGYNLLDTATPILPTSTTQTTSNEADSLFHLKSVDLSISSADEELELTILKSVCFGASIDNEKSITELQTFMEDLFDQVLAEKTRIKRNPRFQDGRIHVTIYFLEPNGHGLKELDLKAMKMISKYTNVLPVIARSDTFDPSELKTFKKRVLADLEYYHIPVYNFSISNEMLDGQYDEDLETINDNQYLASLQPFSIVTADEINGNGEYCRRYNWLNDDTYVPIDTMPFNDLAVLKRVLFGSHLQDFKDTMTNFLYESYRSNKLQSSFEQPKISKISGGISQSPSFVDLKKNAAEGQNINLSSSTPSLSNFQQLVINGQPSTYSLSKLVQQNVSTDDAFADESGFEASSSNVYDSNSVLKEKQNLRNISQTVPYQLTRDRLLHQKQKLEKIETDSAKELQKKIEHLERKAMELKKREKMLKLQKLQQQDRDSESGFVNASVDDVRITQEIEDTSFAKNGEELLTNSDDANIDNSVIKNEL